MMKRLLTVLSGTAIAATGLITAAPAHAAPVTRVILMPGQSVGGMTLGTLLTVFVVPTMYTLFARKGVPGEIRTPEAADAKDVAHA